jgi:hypothetical protein
MVPSDLRTPDTEDRDTLCKDIKASVSVADLDAWDRFMMCPYTQPEPEPPGPEPPGPEPPGPEPPGPEPPGPQPQDDEDDEAKKIQELTNIIMLSVAGIIFVTAGVVYMQNH